MADESLITINPATGEKLAELPMAGAAEVEAAVGAARAAQPAWAALPGAERARILRRAAELLRARNDALATLETRDTGKPIQETRVVDVISGAECLEYFAALAQSAAGEHIDLGPAAFGYTRREAIGITAGIGAWNYPLQIACWKSAPALAFGNAMIFKPASLTPLTAIELEKIYREAGLPQGLFQVVQGHSPTGRLLSRHPAIRKVSLTGSVGTGKWIARAAADTLKRVHLELGGKAPVVVFDDADIEAAAEAIAVAGYFNAGQDCTAATRVLVAEEVHDEFVAALTDQAHTARTSYEGGRHDEEALVPPVNNAQQLDRVLGFLDRVPEHATVVTGGGRQGDRGFYVEPTVVTGLEQDDELIQNEVFGPVITVQTFRTEEEALTKANGVPYALASSVWTRDLGRGLRMSQRLDFGCVWINTHIPLVAEMPHGGFKHSGYGKDLSMYGLEDYTRIKHVMANLES